MRNMNSGNLSDLIGMGLRKIFISRNEKHLEDMRAANTEQEKMELYDKYLAQKFIDEAPKSTLKLKMSDILGQHGGSWVDDAE